MGGAGSASVPESPSPGQLELIHFSVCTLYIKIVMMVVMMMTTIIIINWKHEQK